MLAQVHVSERKGTVNKRNTMVVRRLFWEGKFWIILCFVAHFVLASLSIKPTLYLHWIWRSRYLQLASWSSIQHCYYHPKLPWLQGCVGANLIFNYRDDKVGFCSSWSKKPCSEGELVCRPKAQLVRHSMHPPLYLVADVAVFPYPHVNPHWYRWYLNILGTKTLKRLFSFFFVCKRFLPPPAQGLHLLHPPPLTCTLLPVAHYLGICCCCCQRVRTGNYLPFEKSQPYTTCRRGSTLLA